MDSLQVIRVIIFTVLRAGEVAQGSFEDIAFGLFAGHGLGRTHGSEGTAAIAAEPHVNADAR